ncbi:spore cortex biosynthesis protein YabQ [Gracilibacillus alcaliphilus]|uniref:spore cortex biosynthesis protein YabQ n=1 Tax=Gracilibacillus alcaliphilus TaxID=1401441 RepID=UPI00195E63AA|nr:spore cortex biosynthesis protein YabQ [Gracilibacillus alcaliphilus]MBM7678142.1 spore cortex biosynthesis protein YabQ [Gracilibacillus alcaliphilus]
MTLSTQFITLLAMILSGVYLGMAYHTFKRFEHLWISSILWKYLLEVLFWLIQAIVLYTILFIANEGIVRFYLLLAVLCGYAMFKALLERLYHRMLEVLIHVVKSIYRFIYRLLRLLIIQPIVWIVTMLVAVVLKLLTIIWVVIRWLLSPLFWLGGHVGKIFSKNAKKYLQLFKSFYSKIKRNAK